MSRHVRVVSFLGLGKLNPPHYDLCEYQAESAPGDDTVETPIHDVWMVAKTLRAGDTVSLYVLGTEEVENRWFGANGLYQHHLNEALFNTNMQARHQRAPSTPLTGAVNPIFKLIPKVFSEPEQWEILRIVRDVLRDGVLEAEPAKPSEILLNITHGFRSQPFVSAAAILWQVSEWKRQNTDMPPIRIFYDVFEAALNEQRAVVRPAPVLDLTLILDAHAWNSAIDALMRFGRGDDLERLAKNAQQIDFANKVRRFADGIVTGRVPQLITSSANELQTALSNASKQLIARIPLIEDSFCRLNRWLSGIQAINPISQEGLRASMALARIYLETQRFSELCGLLRETLVSAWTVATRTAQAICQPGEARFSKQREKDEALLGGWENNIEDPRLPKIICDQIAAISKDIKKTRNDVIHCGFNDRSIQPQEIREKVSLALIERLSELINSIEPPVANPPSPKGLVYCGNNPDLWRNESNYSVVALTGTSVEVVKNILSCNPDQVFVDGSLSTAYPIVEQLKRMQIKCVHPQTTITWKSY